MNQLNKLLVCLDGTGHDIHIIKYSAMMAAIVDCKSVDFIHAVQKNTDTLLDKKFRKQIEQDFDHSCDTNFHIIQGDNASDILGWNDLPEMDLIIMGIKSRTASTGRHAVKILKGSLCSVLLVPVHVIAEINKILLPLDFSENSLRAFDVVKSFTNYRSTDVILQHVYFVPMGYSSTGKSYKDFAELMLVNKEKEYEKFKKEHNLDNSNYEMVFTLDQDERPADNIYDLAEERGVGMIVMGSTSRTKAASLLLQSTSVSLLKYDKNIPFMIVKEKEESIGFFDALLKV